MVVLSLLVRFLLLNLQLSVQCFVYQRVCCLYQCSSCYSIFSCLCSVLCINVCVVFTGAVRVTQSLAVYVVLCVSVFVLSLLVRIVLLNIQLSVQCFVYQRLCCLYQCGSCYSIFSCLCSILCINVCVVFTSAVRVTQYLAVCVVF